MLDKTTVLSYNKVSVIQGEIYMDRTARSDRRFRIRAWNYWDYRWRLDTRIHNIWYGMVKRCTTTKEEKDLRNYKNRGITVCDEWIDNFMNFFNWAISHGYDDDLQIDRIDNEGNYEPSNCRWATPKENSNNTRVNRRITINGITKNITQWCSEYNISMRTVYRRLKEGWSEIDAVTKPVIEKFKSRRWKNI